MTDEQNNKILKARLTKYLICLGGNKEMLIENEIAFKVKGVHKCIFKHPYKKQLSSCLYQWIATTTITNYTI